MSITMQIVFWISVGLIVYAYVGYPALMGLWARVAGRAVRPQTTIPRGISVVIAAYNEQGTIGRRVREFVEQLPRYDRGSEIIVVSDGSTDGTAKAAAVEAGRGNVRVIEMSGNVGKALALNAGVAAATNPIVIFADARQTWAEDTLDRLLENFADPEVGAVSGDLVLSRDDGALGGVGVYWRMEKWLRRRESLVHSSVVATGAISAVRRELFRPLPPGAILDDVCWPINVALQGRRVIHDPRAVAFDHLPSKAGDEFRRKVRTLSGSLQLVQLQPRILWPGGNPVWFGFVSKKLARLGVPWAMIMAMASSALLAGESELYLSLLAMQLAGYAVGVMGLRWRAIGRSRMVGTISSLLVLNGAAFVAFWVWIMGRTGTAWKKAAYNRQSVAAVGRQVLDGINSGA
jgi:poly-beta-1,6-N-acetyl-D-glucosamine synthase